MARVRFLGAEPVTVPELGNRLIQPDELIQVPDERFGGYVCQTTVWEPVEEPRDWVWPMGEDAESESESEAVAEPEPKATAAKKTTAAAKAATSKEG
ncbi:hypothetical protein [Streptomyces sp. NBC_00829]|uniref:hypothetical protein n=1 Tax=Streptomyces sp. NBC_00829 TaxID=2903679 RepID=UPI00386A7276|nr:hypothetical protein OG293_23130 [Streptomyces sp. NBC_00829]